MSFSERIETAPLPDGAKDYYTVKSIWKGFTIHDFPRLSSKILALEAANWLAENADYGESVILQKVVEKEIVIFNGYSR